MIEINDVSRTYRRGVGRHPCARARVRRHRGRPLRRLHGAVGLGQVDAAQPGVGHRPAERRRGVRRRRRRLNDLSEDELAHWRARHVGLIFQFFNLMPVLDARDNVALPLLLTHLDKRRAPAARRDRAARRRPRRALRPLPAHAVGRRAAARRHRPRHRHRSRPDRRRRADRRPRRAQRRGDPQPAAPAQERVRQDGRHGHPRSARAALRRRRATPRQGPAARRRGRASAPRDAIRLAAGGGAGRRRARTGAMKYLGLIRRQPRPQQAAHAP